MVKAIERLRGGWSYWDVTLTTGETGSSAFECDVGDEVDIATWDGEHLTYHHGIVARSVKVET